MQSSRSAYGFEAVVLGWIVAAGDHDPSGSLEMHDRIIEQRGRPNSDVQHISPAGKQTFQKRIVNPATAQPAIAAQADRAPAVANQIRAERAPQQLDIGIQQLFIGNAANIVLAENTRFQHKNLEQLLPPHY